MSTAGRPLLAAQGDNDSPGPEKFPAPNRPKRTLIESACQACRKRKSKCDGLRPECSRCVSLRSDCVYEAEEGESRWMALKRRNQQLEMERDAYRQLLEWIQVAPEADAFAIVERVRATHGDNLVDLVNSMRHRGQVTAGPLSPGPYSHEDQRLPPISSLVGTRAPLNTLEPDLAMEDAPPSGSFSSRTGGY